MTSSGLPRTAAVAPAPFFGVVAEDVLAGDAAYRRRTLAQQRAAGVRLIRQTFHWDRIERAPGRYDFGEYDAYMEALSRAGIDVLPILFTPPRFRAKGGPARGTYPPDDPGDMGDFAARLVGRYGPDGDFWAEHPDVPEHPIRAWQVWNEPNLPVYWPSGPDPEQYAELLAAVAKAIKRADPGASVVSAGLSESRQGIPFADFVRGMFAAGAGDTIDVFALHAFAHDTAGSVAAAEAARELLSQLGSGAPIWITEIGWASGGPASPFTVGPDGQAERIRAALEIFHRRREELGLHGVIYFNWRDAPLYEGGQDFFGLHTGLLDIDGKPKPALDAYRSVARQTRRLSVRYPRNPPGATQGNSGSAETNSVPFRAALALAACLIAALALAPSAGAAPFPRDFVGISAEDVFAGDPGYRDANLQAQSSLGIGLLRQKFDWAEIETAPGQYDLRYHDEFVAAAASKGITIMPILFHTPDFHLGRRNGNNACPPRDNASLRRLRAGARPPLRPERDAVGGAAGAAAGADSLLADLERAQPLHVLVRQAERTPVRRHAARGGHRDQAGRPRRSHRHGRASRQQDEADRAAHALRRPDVSREGGEVLRLARDQLLRQGPPRPRAHAGRGA